MRWRVDPVRLDQLVAICCLVAGEIGVVVSARRGPAQLVTALLVAVVTVSVATRRRHPFMVGVGVQAVLVAAVSFVQLPAGGVTIAWFCALYGLAVWTTTRLFVVGVVFFALSDVLPAVAHQPIDANGVVWPFTMGAVVVMILIRRIVGDRERRLRVAERETELAAREAVVEERARIARELHDVIAHHVSLMVVQAGAERRVLPAEQDSTRDVLALIERIGRDALTETRRLVGMLRDGDGETLAPQPGIDDVATLVEQMRAAGLPVELVVDGEPRQLPVGVGLSAYRIVQEGLTNALKHSRGTSASVHVHYGSTTLELEITDGGGGAGSPNPAAGGHGLVGIRERVAMYGGAFDAGRRPGGGFGIRVLLPVR